MAALRDYRAKADIGIFSDPENDRDARLKLRGMKVKLKLNF